MRALYRLGKILLVFLATTGLAPSSLATLPLPGLGALATYLLGLAQCPNTGAPVCPCKAKALAASVAAGAAQQTAMAGWSLPELRQILLEAATVLPLTFLFDKTLPSCDWRIRAAADSAAAAALVAAFHYATQHLSAQKTDQAPSDEEGEEQGPY